MTNVNETVVSYLAAWNERDPKRRREFVAAAWTEEGSYIDANHRLSLVSGIEAHNNFVRFSWAAGGTAEAPLYIGGTDFATLAPDGRMKTVAGFMDASPAM
jgi:hypothetical protein